tara:strand:+ start:4277 stop:4855 length:579 start_codon:yes stop_codon:yes gene_type:complete
MSTATLTKPKALESKEGEISICIQCLASYNEGTHHFFWCDLEAIDLDNFEEEFQKCIDYVIKTSPSNSAEEWFFTDHENLSAIYDEYQDIKTIKEYLEKYQEFKENNISIDLMNEYLENYGDDHTYSDFESAYRGAYDSNEAYAEEFYTECGDYDPDTLSNLVIDWEATWRYSLQYDMTVLEADGESHYFLD